MRRLALAACALLCAACGEKPAPNPGVATDSVASRPARLARAPDGARAGMGFGDAGQVFQVGLPVANRALASIGAGEVPYARPDLSLDPQERARARLVQEALLRYDVRTAQALANTQALQEMVNLGQREQAAYLQDDRAASSADRETQGQPER
ncbi:MAG TPA: hypothetical protein VIT92_06700 [Burkholderiaceae bacterium]